MCLSIPGRATSIFREHDVLMGKVDFSGITQRVCLEHVPQVQVGQYVLVHVGFALSCIDEAEARQVFEFLHSMNQLDKEISDPRVSEAELSHGGIFPSGRAKSGRANSGRVEPGHVHRLNATASRSPSFCARRIVRESDAAMP